jgi:hypothetical protein
VSTEPIIFQNDNEVELWTAIVNGMGAFERRIVEADAAVRELRARMRVEKPAPADDLGPRVVQCEDGHWLIVRGKDGLEWWHLHMQMWLLHSDLGTGIYFAQSEAAFDLASLTPAQRAAACGVEVRA